MADVRAGLSRVPHTWRPTYFVRRARRALSRRGTGVPPEDAGLESRLVWMLGSPRTGSTWLLRLVMHPLRLVETPSGVSAPLWPPGGDRPNLVPIDETRLFEHLTPPVREPLPPYRGSDREDYRDFLLSGVLGERSSYFFSDQYAEAWRPKARELVLARLRAQVDLAARELGLADPLVLIKEPQSHGAETVMSLLPRSRLVFLMRDGREVLRSQLALRAPGGRLAEGPVAPKRGNEAARLRFVLQQGRRWAQRMSSVQAAYEAHPPELRTTVRYEDLARDTFGELRRLTDWIGLGRTDEQLRASVEAEAARRVPRGSGRRDEGDVAERDPRQWDLSDAERRLCDEVMGPMLAKLGYPA